MKSNTIEAYNYHILRWEDTIMIKLIVGKKGSGKSRALINDANEVVKNAKGHIVFIDEDNSRMFQIDYKIRFMGIKEYQLTNDENFYGFLCGIIASNYDVDHIYIDGLTNIVEMELADLEEFFRKIDELEVKYNINFIFTINDTGEELPTFLENYMIYDIK